MKKVIQSYVPLFAISLSLIMLVFISHAAMLSLVPGWSGFYLFNKHFCLPQ